MLTSFGPPPSVCPSQKIGFLCFLPAIPIPERQVLSVPAGQTLFTDGSFKRQADGCELAGWGIAAVSPDNFVRISCCPFTCDPGHPAFLGATSCSSNTAELTGFADALRRIDSFNPVVNVFAFV